jgi:hypothetical protein
LGAEVEKQMENTGNTATYLRLSSQCRSCRQLASDVAKFYAAGGFVKWQGWRIISIKPYANSAKHNVYAMRAQSAPTIYQQASTSAKQRLPGGVATDLVTISRTPSGWRVAGFTKLGT